MMNTVLGRGNNNILQPTEFPNVLGVIPKLTKEMKGRQNGNNILRYSQNSSWNHKQCTITKYIGIALTKCTGHIKLFTTVVNDVLVPEKIDFVIEAVGPVRSKIDTDKGSEVKPKIRFDLGNGSC